MHTNTMYMKHSFVWRVVDILFEFPYLYTFTRIVMIDMIFSILNFVNHILNALQYRRNGHEAG